MSNSEYVLVDCVNVPKILFQDKKYEGLSVDAKMLYSLLLDRMERAKMNGWEDSQGKFFVVYPKREMKKDLNVSRYRVDMDLGELKNCNEMVVATQPEPGQACRIYVKDITGTIKEKMEDKMMNKMTLEERKAAETAEEVYIQDVKDVLMELDNVWVAALKLVVEFLDDLLDKCEQEAPARQDLESDEEDNENLETEEIAGDCLDICDEDGDGKKALQFIMECDDCPNIEKCGDHYKNTVEYQKLSEKYQKVVDMYQRGFINVDHEMNIPAISQSAAGFGIIFAEETSKYQRFPKYRVHQLLFFMEELCAKGYYDAEKDIFEMYFVAIGREECLEDLSCCLDNVKKIYLNHAVTAAMGHLAAIDLRS